MEHAVRGDAAVAVPRVRSFNAVEAGEASTCLGMITAIGAMSHGLARGSIIASAGRWRPGRSRRRRPTFERRRRCRVPASAAEGQHQNRWWWRTHCPASRHPAGRAAEGAAESPACGLLAEGGRRITPTAGPWSSMSAIRRRTAPPFMKAFVPSSGRRPTAARCRPRRRRPPRR